MASTRSFVSSNFFSCGNRPALAMAPALALQGWQMTAALSHEGMNCCDRTNVWRYPAMMVHANQKKHPTKLKSTINLVMCQMTFKHKGSQRSVSDSTQLASMRCTKLRVSSKTPLIDKCDEYPNHGILLGIAYRWFSAFKSKKLSLPTFFGHKDCSSWSTARGSGSSLYSLSPQLSCA